MRKNTIPTIVKDDPWLSPYQDEISARLDRFNHLLKDIKTNSKSLKSFSQAYLELGINFSKKEKGIVTLLMASLTHPGFYIALSPLLFFGVLFFLLFYCRKPKILSPAVDVAPLQEYNRDIPFVKSPKIKTEPRCPSATEIGRIVLELSKLATNPESDQTQKEIIRLGRKLDFLPKISSNSNLVYAFRTILEFLGEKDAQKVAHIWEENGWNVRKWMSEDLYSL